MLLFWWLWIGQRGFVSRDDSPAGAATMAEARARASNPGRVAGSEVATEQFAGKNSAADDPAGLLRRRLEEKDARANEAVLTFKSGEAYRNFLAKAARLGLRVRGRLDALRIVRVGYDSLDPLLGDILGNPADYAGIDPNHLVRLPATPAAENRPQVSQVALGNHTLEFLGVTGDHSQWGRGISIAVLDTGVASDVTLAGGRVRYLDVGMGIMPGLGLEDGHGTAVAGLAAGASPDAPGVAPAASILSIRVTDADGMSDSFTLAQGIVAAVDAGARIINISMGSYAAAGVLSAAIEYAGSQGALIVASAGNDGAAQLTWPAADPRVVSVGAVDALEQQVYFSNAGEQLKVTAPGYGIDAAWLDGSRVSFDGTSASAPLVAGAIAAMMSVSPGLSATQAWGILQQHVSDGGAPGADADYGAGILNVGWAMDRNNVARVDTAIAGEYYDATTGTMNVVVQNRGAQSVGGLQLSVNIGGVSSTNVVPSLASGATFLFQAPITAQQIAANGGIVFRTRLTNPVGLVDQVPANNAKSGVIVPPVK